MTLVQLKNISLAFGANPILDNINFSLAQGERVCLLGRNGEGKSTLLKLISQQISPDDGEIITQDGLTIATLAQDLPDDNISVLECVLAGNPVLAQCLSDYQRYAHACTQGDMNACTQMSEISQRIDDLGGWDFKRFAGTLIDNMGLMPTDNLADLSGGKKRRALLAKALACRPDVLLLDEPTNHLDIDSIAWLEQFLLSQNLTVLFITHDRQFVDKLATRIVELDRGRLNSYDLSQGVGGFARYQELKALELASEQKSFAEFDKKLAQEEAWIRQGIKARRTRNEGRVRALKALREERKARRDVVGNININQNSHDKSGKIVCEVVNLCLEYDNKPLVKNFSTVLMRGDKVAIIGKNGVGKTTLIKTILGLDYSAKTAGTITLGSNLQVAFFDQLKDQLDLDQSIAENVSEGSDYIEVSGQKRHILGYLQDFLFSPSRARTPVKALSGGEKARVLLAKLLLKPANVLVLDEPTNDLDMASLELLEEFVANFTGTVLLISHDRQFVDNIATQTWVFAQDGDDGIIYEYAGGYEDYLVQHARFVANNPKLFASQSQSIKANQDKQSTKTASNTNKNTKKKLSYKEQQELANLPLEIEQLEQEQADLHAKLADGLWFVSDLAAATKASERLGEIDNLLLKKLERWDSLESLS